MSKKDKNVIWGKIMLVGMIIFFFGYLSHIIPIPLLSLYFYGMECSPFGGNIIDCFSIWSLSSVIALFIMVYLGAFILHFILNKMRDIKGEETERFYYKRYFISVLRLSLFLAGIAFAVGVIIGLGFSI